MINAINREACRKISRAIEERMADFLNENNLSIRVHGGRFNLDCVTMKVEVAMKDGNGNARSKLVVDFETYAPAYGFNESDCGASFTYKGRSFKIAGWNPRAQRFPVVAIRDDDKQFKFPASTVKDAMRSD